MSDSNPESPKGQEVLITRIFDAPREKVTIDLRVGGRYELTMVPRGGGGEFPVGYEIVELVVPEPGEKTRMTLSDGPYPIGADGAEGGWRAALDALAAALDG